MARRRAITLRKRLQASIDTTGNEPESRCSSYRRQFRGRPSLQAAWSPRHCLRRKNHPSEQLRNQRKLTHARSSAGDHILLLICTELAENMSFVRLAPWLGATRGPLAAPVFQDRPASSRHPITRTFQSSLKIGVYAVIQDANNDYNESQTGENGFAWPLFPKRNVVKEKSC